MSDVTEHKEMTEGFWTCNIDRKGRAIRLLAGLLFLACAAWLWWGPQNAFLASGLLALGLVAVFEGLRGWCVIRAFGGRTPW